MSYNPAMRAHAGTLVWRTGGSRMLAGYHRPAGPAGRRFPAVLFLHGFPGAEKSVDVQRELMARGVASVAPHFLGAWGSGGLYRFSTLTAQARAALRAARRLEFVDARRLAVYGFSMGGWTALNLAAREPGLRAVVAVSPMGGPECADAGTRAFLARLSRPLNAPPAAVLREDFRRALFRFDPARAVASSRAPLLLVHGQDDEVVPPSVSRCLARRAAGPVRLRLLRGAGHDFLECRPRLARLAADFLCERLA